VTPFRDEASVPRVSGAQNGIYLSPTFKSNKVFYGDEQDPKNHFCSQQKAEFHSPMGGRIIEKANNKLDSTNKLAVYGNKFHKSRSNINLKNFSQLNMGCNENIGNAYAQQVENRRVMADLHE
jgi:hypothetical protein